MGIKPIDMQSNMSQMGEVGKNEQTRSEALIQQQHILERESNEKARIVNTKMDEAKKGERTSIQESERKMKQRAKKNREQEKEKEDKIKERKKFKDGTRGTIIDILK